MKFVFVQMRSNGKILNKKGPLSDKEIPKIFGRIRSPTIFGRYLRNSRSTFNDEVTFFFLTPYSTL
jgi:hypothetical protein